MGEKEETETEKDVSEEDLDGQEDMGVQEEDNSSSLIEESEWKERKIVWWSNFSDEILCNFQIPTKDSNNVLTEEDELKLFRFAQKIFEEEKQKQKVFKSSLDEKISEKGTREDRINISLLTLFQSEEKKESLMFKLDLVDFLLKQLQNEFESVKNRSLVDGLKKLFLYHLIPADHKLRFFTNNNLALILKNKKELGDSKYSRIMKTLYFEGELKKRVNSFFTVLQDQLKSTKSAPFLKIFILRTIRLLAFRLEETREQGIGLFLDILRSPKKNQLTAHVLYYFSTIVNPHSFFTIFPKTNPDSLSEKTVLVQKAINLIFSLHSDVVFNAVSLLRLFVFDKQTETKLIHLRAQIFLKLVEKFSIQIAGAAQKFSKKRKRGQPKKPKKSEEKEEGSLDTISSDVNDTIIAKMIRTLAGSVKTCQITSKEKAKDLNESNKNLFEEKHIDMLFAIARKSSSVIVSVESARCVFQICKVTPNDEKLVFRYFVLVYDLILKIDAHTHLASSVVPDFLLLIKQSILFDTKPNRMSAFIKRLFQMSFTSTPPIAALILLYLREIVVIRQKQLIGLFGEVTENSQEKFDPTAIDPAKACSNPKLWEAIAMKNYFNLGVSSINNSLITKERRINYKRNPIQDFSTLNSLNQIIESDKELPQEKSSTLSEQKEDSCFDKERLLFIKKFKEIEKELKLEGEVKNDDGDVIMTEKEANSTPSNTQENIEALENEMLKSFESKKKITKKVVDFSDNKIEDFFFDAIMDEKGSTDKKGNLDGFGEDDDEDEEEKKGAPKKRRKLDTQMDNLESTAKSILENSDSAEDDWKEKEKEKKESKIIGIDEDSKGRVRELDPKKAKKERSFQKQKKKNFTRKQKKN